MTKKDEIISKIKKKSYWEINIHPDIYKPDRIEKPLRDTVKAAVVLLRGWDYPHFSDNYGDLYNIQNGIESTLDWSRNIEFWRFTQSANFYHLLALREDWIENGEYRNIWSRGDELRGKKLLGFLGALYTLSEIFEFAKRLASQNIFDENVVVEIKLHDLNERMLYVDSYNRIPFSYPRVAKVSEPWSYNKQNLSVIELLNKSNEIAFNAYLELVHLFQWENPPIENLKNDQEKFLQGKI